MPISIHLMFLLIKVRNKVSHHERFYFNTSHVSINPLTLYLDKLERDNFNTSHVSINPI